MSTRAKYCRAAGTIVDGRIRDLQEHRDLDYPVRRCSSCGLLAKFDSDQIQVFAKDVGTASPQGLLRVSEVRHKTQRTLNFSLFNPSLNYMNH